MSDADLFLPGVAVDAVRTALSSARGSELSSGKFISPRSSAALAVNCFGWFIDRPEALPPLPGIDDLDWPAERVSIERVMRFPWVRGTHPHLDAGIETKSALIGVESKRFEPFLDEKKVEFRPAYDRDWGAGLAPFVAMRDALIRGALRFQLLDAAQLVKHAFGLATEAGRIGKIPILYYLYAEPTEYAGKVIPPADIAAHRAEVVKFAEAVSGSHVRFAFGSYLTYLARFIGDERSAHATRLSERFAPQQNII